MDNPAAPISSIPSTSPQPAESPDRRWLLWSAIGLTFLIFGIAIGVFGAKFLNQSPNLSQFPPTPTLTLSPISSPAADLNREPTGSAATAGWKTYTNTRYGYTFKYPEDTEVSWPYEPEGFIFITPKIKDVNESMKMNIGHFENSNSLSAKDLYNKLFADRQKEAEEKELPAPIPPEGGTKEIKINGLNAFQTLGNFAGDGGIKHTYITNGKVVVNISFYDINPNYQHTDQFVELFDQILSTFKFTD